MMTCRQIRFEDRWIMEYVNFIMTQADGSFKKKQLPVWSAQEIIRVLYECREIEIFTMYEDSITFLFGLDKLQFTGNLSAITAIRRFMKETLKWK